MDRFPLSRLLFLTILMLTGTVSFTSSQEHLWWQWQHPLPTGSDLYAVAFPSPTTAILTGANGTILRTVDAGGTWTQIAPPVPSTLLCAAFTDSLRGFVAGGDNVFLATTDGGLTWSARSLGASAYFSAIRFATPDLGVVVGGTLLPSCAILRTVDGGVSWTPRPSPTTQPLNDVVFVGADHAWAVGGEGTILHSSDGGDHWELQRKDTTTSKYSLAGVYFHDTLNGTAVGENDRIMRTTDGGTTWTIIRQGFNSSKALQGVSFATSRTGFAYGPLTGYRTTDGGETWHGFGIAPTLLALNFNTNIGYAIGQTGTIRRTADTGTTWSAESNAYLPFALNDIVMLDSAQGVTVGAFGLIARTTDAGNSWNRYEWSNQYNLAAVSCGDTAHWCACAENGTIIHTTNGGGTWKSGTGSGPGRLYDISMGTPLHAWSVGVNGTILHSTDGGATWNPQNSGTTVVLFSVDFADSTFGMAVGRNGVLLRTGNGGETWQQMSSGVTTPLTMIELIDRRIGFAVGSGQFLQTTDGGESWAVRSIPGAPSIVGMDFINSGEGWLTLETGDVLHTTDSGASWSHEPSRVISLGAGAARFSGISFTDARNGTIAGRDGAILRYRPKSQGTTSLPAPVTDPTICNTQNAATSPTLRWSPTPAATAYHLQVSRQASFDFSVDPAVTDAQDIADTFRLVGPLSPSTTYYWRVRATDGSGTGSWSQICTITTTDETVDAPAIVADPNPALSIGPVRPNPSRNSIMFSVHLAHTAHIRITIHDEAGREVMAVTENEYPAGDHEVGIGLEALPSGVYHLCLKSLAGTATTSLVIQH